MLAHVGYTAALLVTALVSLLAVLHPRFNDNTLQRVGLVVISFCAWLNMYTYLDGQDLPILRDGVLYGVAVYAAGTLLKFRRFDRATQEKQHANK